MQEKKKIIIEILSDCHKIDTTAYDLYQDFSRASTDADLKKFWQGMADDEKEHIEYWNKLLQIAEDGYLPPLFHEPDFIKKDLTNIIKRVASLKKSVKKNNTITHQFLLAYRIEFYMLHRAFAFFFHFLKTIPDEKSPEDKYEDHINKFISKIDQFKHNSLELELLGETVTALWRDNKKLAVMTTHDMLMGILNRKGLFDSMNLLSHLAMRNEYFIGIMMIDIDNFKKINDTYGHQKGDELLVLIADTIKTNIRHSDILGRYGGEEIVVFLSKIDINDLKRVAEKIRSSVEKQTKNFIPATISIGMSHNKIVSDPDRVVNDLIKIADKNLYRAKERGRNRVVV